MSGRGFHIGTDVHQKVQTLLPWYVAASLGAEERASVEAHLAECLHCRSELAWERRLQALHDDGDMPRDVEQDLALLRQRIESGAARPRGAAFAARLMRGWSGGPAWMRWALLVQCVVIAVLGVSLFVRPVVDDRYRALGAAAAPGAAGHANLVVRFQPGATEQAIRRVLRDNDARLVYGPTTTDAYLLVVPAGQEAATVARLRKESAVLLVESLDGRAAP